MRRNKFLWLGILFCFLGCARDTYLITSDGVRIAYEYKTVKGENGTAVLLHGYGSSLEEWYDFGKFLRAHGWSTLAFDFRGHGMSTEWRGKEIEWKQLTESGRLSMIKDIEAVVKFIPVPRNLWLIGSSVGANLALNFAADHPEAAGVVLLSPGFNYGGIESQPAMEKYGSRPVLIAGSEDDPGTPKICMLLQQKARGENRLLLYEKAGHGSAMLESEKGLQGEILKWMNLHRN